MELNKYKVVFILILNMIINNCVGQNLVTNPSFEVNKHFFSFRTLGALSNWFKINSTTPDFITNEFNIGGRQKPFDGKYFIGITHSRNKLTTNYVEYVSVKLINSVKANQNYCLSMYVSRGDDCVFALKSLEAAITLKKINGKGTGYILSQNYVALGNKEDSLLRDAKGWQKVCANYVASGNERYLTIGYFNPESPFYKVARGSRTDLKTYYYIDNVSLIEINDTTTCDCSYQPKKLEPLPIQVIQHTEVGENMVLENIYFATQSSTIDEASFASLNNLASQLKQQPSLVLEIQGYTDNVGSDADNLELSTQRAKSVADYLITKGVLQTQVQYNGYGSTKPIADNNTEEGRQKNRRIEIKVMQK